METIRVDDVDVAKIKKRLRLDNNQFIGQFAPQQTEGWYEITDIRNTDFTKIEDKERGVKNLVISFKSLNNKFNRFAYYKFTWVLLETSPLKFGIDLKEEITLMYPKDIISSLYEGIMHYSPGAAQKISRSLDTLKKQLTQSGKEVFIYELLQNANDYPQRNGIDKKLIAQPVEVEFHIGKNYLIFQHTGEYFNPKNIAAICDINDGEKSENKKAIGYKGIGFKTVFLDNDYVFLNTGNYSFRFDKSATDVIDTPWQILPIWTENSDIDNDIKEIFKQHPNDEFRVRFALQPRDKDILTDKSQKGNYIDLFSSVFDSERIILFIPNIKKVSVFVEGKDKPIVREKDNNDWCVSDSFVDSIPEEITEKINDVFNNPNALRSDGYEKIPEKYKDFHETTVKFACQKKGRQLIPVEDAFLYCYLPAKRADLGFKFLMNTDMVPNGQRDDIEDIEINHVIAKIAGRQFFYWIKQLIECGEYDLDSIFSLIPNFDECKKIRAYYKTFIEEFQCAFETLIKEEPFVPVVSKEGEHSSKCINEVINDKTEMTAHAVMTDSDFITLMEMDDYCLPVDELRQSKSFSKFIYKYSPSKLDIKVEQVVEKCEVDDFQKWLTDVENNARFIKHWLDKDELDKFAKKKIFIEYNGELFTANKLYYDFEMNCSGIGFMRCFIPHLCQASRDRLDTIEKWKAFADKYFKSFSASDMILTYIIPNENAITLLNKPTTSVAFYHYLAKWKVDLKANSAKIPYITEDGEASKDYKNCQYFYTEDAYGLTQEAWIGENIVNILSHIYFDGLDEKNKNELKTLFVRLGFCEFDKASFITTYIVGDANFRANVNVAIEKNYAANKAFVNYVYAGNVQLKENSLKDYVLLCVDKDGHEIYLCNDCIRYFNQEAYGQNSTYTDNIDHAWLTSDMMYALSNSYFELCEKEEAKKLGAFLRLNFGIKTFTDKSFFTDVVIKNKALIYGSLVDEDTMQSFLAYLKRDAEHIFDDTMSFNDIKDMPLLCYDGTIVKTREANVQYMEYNEDAIVLYEKVWCPKAFVILAKTYTDDFTQDMHRLFKITRYDINSVLGTILLNTSLIQSVNKVEQNIDFWRWVKVNQKHITSFEKLKTIPLIDKNDVPTLHQLLYISDTYQQDKIESLVIRYVKDAQFISSTYVENNTENEKIEWMKLFKKLGLKSDNKDILFSDILPSLSTFEEDSVVALMTKHLKDLKDKWTERRSQIIQLRVRTRSGEYKPLNQVIIVNIEEESIVEPFRYIPISNEVHPEILNGNKELLLLILAEYGNQNLISTKRAWIVAKVKEYIHQFNVDESSIADIHVQFVREVAKLQNEYDIDANLRGQIKYRVKGEEETYKYVHELTLSSAYSPDCDFEANGVIELSYLSDVYIFEDNKDTIKQYFKNDCRGIHQNMLREDLKFLSIRQFACYFWMTCFSRRIVEYRIWINEGLFKNIVCIPTEKSVQKAELLYEPRITANYAVRAKVPQWEEKVPCKAIVNMIDNSEARELFEELDFNTRLSFGDCLHYLAQVNDSRTEELANRRIVINWILDAPTHDSELVEMYRNKPTSTWRNGKGQKKHISELYAIHPDASQERNVFKGDEFVIQTSCFPSDSKNFEKICEILQIKYLKSSDFKVTPIGKVDETQKMVSILSPRLLVLAAIKDSDKFQQLYECYNEKLLQYHFNVCEKIDLGYENIHNDVMRIYDDKTHIYYVGSWEHNRTFIKFCDSLRKLIDCPVDIEVCEDVLDATNTVESCIEKYCASLKFNENFQSCLTSLGLKIEIKDDEKSGDKAPRPYYDPPENNTNKQDENEINGSQPPYAPIDGSNTRVNHSGEDKINITNGIGNNGQINGVDAYTGGSTNSISNQTDEDDSLKNGPQTTNTQTTPQSTTTDPVHKGDGVNDTTEEESEDENNTFVQIPGEDINKGGNVEGLPPIPPSKRTSNHYSNPDRGGYMGSENYQPIGDTPIIPRSRKSVKRFTYEEIERLRSHGTPLELKSLPPTTEEREILGQCGISSEQIADANYLAQYRLYRYLEEKGEAPAETMEEFVKNAKDVSLHKLKNGKSIHACSAARGVMYISPSIWNKVIDENCRICFYRDGQGSDFHFIDSSEDFLQLVEKDDVVIKITGKEKIDVVKALYTGLLKNVKGTAYTLIRVTSHTNMDNVFAHYVGAMAEPDDGNDSNEY